MRPMATCIRVSVTYQPTPNQKFSRPCQLKRNGTWIKLLRRVSYREHWTIYMNTFEFITNRNNNESKNSRDDMDKTSNNGGIRVRTEYMAAIVWSFLTKLYSFYSLSRNMTLMRLLM